MKLYPPIEIAFGCDGVHVLPEMVPWARCSVTAEQDKADASKMVLVIRLPDGWTVDGSHYSVDGPKHYCSECSKPRLIQKGT